jgi:PPOX class probable F420-dependent enzyme
MPALPPADDSFGAKIRSKFDHDMVVWLTTVGADGTPQPNPVWFVVDDQHHDTVVVYNMADSSRLQHLQVRPQVSLSFNNGDGNRDAVVLTGTAVIDSKVTPADRNDAFLQKYRHHMTKVGFTPAKYAAAFPTAIRVTIKKARGL